METFLLTKHAPGDYASFFRDLLDKKADGLVMKAMDLGFFEAPASSTYHHAYPGGLPHHSIEVLYWAKQISPGFAIDISSIEARIAILFHDLCKAGLYETYQRNVKDDLTGQWNKVTAFKQSEDGKAGMGHGEESLRRIEIASGQMMPEAWALAVRWHMGPFMLLNEQASQYTATCKKYPEVLLLHTTDMLSSTREIRR